MSPVCFSESRDAAVTIEAVYDVIRKMKPSKKSEQYVKQYLIPLLTSKFHGLNDFIRGAGYAVENELLVSEKNSLIREIRKMTEEYRKLQKEKEKLQSDLASRTAYCNRQCRFSREQYISEQKKFLDSMLEDSADVELYIKALAAGGDSSGRRMPSAQYDILSELNGLLRQKNSLKKEFKSRLGAFVDAAPNPAVFNDCGINNHSATAGEKLARLAVETCILMMNAVALEIAYKFLSTFDYCMQLNHDGKELAARLSKFKKALSKSGAYTDDIKNRIQDHEKSLGIFVEGGSSAK